MQLIAAILMNRSTEARVKRDLVLLVLHIVVGRILSGRIRGLRAEVLETIASNFGNEAYATWYLAADRMKHSATKRIAAAVCFDLTGLNPEQIRFCLPAITRLDAIEKSVILPLSSHIPANDDTSMLVSTSGRFSPTHIIQFARQSTCNRLVFVRNGLTSTDSLATVAATLDNADIAYSDEDTMKAEGQLVCPFFKPGFDLHLLERLDYISSFFAIDRTRVLEQPPSTGEDVHSYICLSLIHI